MTRKSLTFTLEAMPFPPELKSDNLQLPWRAGAFRTEDAIDGCTWMKIRDSFNSFYVSEAEAHHAHSLTPPGWRFTFEALVILFESGYTANLSGIVIGSRAELEAVLETISAAVLEPMPLPSLEFII